VSHPRDHPSAGGDEVFHPRYESTDSKHRTPIKNQLLAGFLGILYQIQLYTCTFTLI